jgi:uncharacterized protein YbjQ (UPF0145 family)
MILTTTPTIEGKQIIEYKGIDLDFEMLGTNNGMMMVTATGTAVIYKEYSSLFYLKICKE